LREVNAPIQGTVVSVDVRDGDVVREGAQLVVLEAMKMEHVVAASEAGVVATVRVAVGDTVMPGDVLLTVTPHRAGAGVGPGALDESVAEDPGGVRADLAAVIERHDVGLDHRRPEAVARRRASGQRTARENVADLVDEGSFVEYAPLVVAAQRRRRSLEELIARTPADGLVGGMGKVAGRPVIAMSYDYTVLAGTQGVWNHHKKDRLFDLAERLRLPIVFFTEGGGGRPGDTDATGVAYLDCLAFHDFAALSGLVPLVGINSGFCFAGNAAILGCCDVIIATANSNLGMGGPAMIEGGGLGTYEPTDIGPMSVQVANGVVDLAVEDEAEAVAVAKQYLSYFYGRVDEWTCADQDALRSLVPESRVRVYDVRRVIDTLFDTGSVLELRRGWGEGMVTALARVEGRPLGVIANNPAHLGGAIDVDAADKASRFLQLCDGFDLPVLFLCDTPGFMVGPDHEARAALRHLSRMFVTGPNATVPIGTVVLRKGYGLGAQAMAAGSFKAPLFCVAWPTGEFGGMNLEGAVRLGQRRELEAIDDPEERERAYREMVERMYEHGSAISMASHLEIDDVIDPADTRRWISTMLEAAPVPTRRDGKKRSYVDTW
jgi:acetyl-CoA carboxylase carboxyltransferase component